MVARPRKRLKSSELRRRQKRSEGEAEQRASLSARRIMVVQVLEERTYPLLRMVQKVARQVWLVEKVLRVFWDPLSANPVTHPMALLMKASVEFLVKEFVEEDLVEEDLKEEGVVH